MRYVKDTDFGSLEVRKNEKGVRFVTLASIAEMLGMSDTSYLVERFKYRIKKPDGEPSLPLSDLTASMTNVPLGKCSVGSQPALNYLRLHAADEIADMVLPSSGAKGLVPVIATVLPPAHETLRTLCPIQPIRIGREDTNAVDGMGLYRFLSPKSPFPVWIERALEKYIQHSDYEKVITDDSVLYMIDTRVAEHIAMQEDSTAGREVRNYFQQCRDELRGGGGFSEQLNALSERIGVEFQAMWTEQREQRALLNERLSKQEALLNQIVTHLGVQPPRIDFPAIPLLSTATPDEGFTMRQVAQMVQMSGRCDGRNSLPQALETAGWIEKRGGAIHWTPTATAIQAGYLARHPRVRLTAKGVELVQENLAGVRV